MVCDAEIGWPGNRATLASLICPGVPGYWKRSVVLTRKLFALDAKARPAVKKKFVLFSQTGVKQGLQGAFRKRQGEALWAARVVRDARRCDQDGRTIKRSRQGLVDVFASSSLLSTVRHCDSLVPLEGRDYHSKLSLDAMAFFLVVPAEAALRATISVGDLKNRLGL